MDRIRTIMPGLILALGLTNAGCRTATQPSGPTLARIQAATPEDYEQLWEASARSLRRCYFRLDRQDRLEGIITTHRDTTANWFEWWRTQPRTPQYWLEANIHTIQRQAKVHIRPTDEAGVYDLDVQIDRYRYSFQERQTDNSAGALRLFSGEAPTYSGKNVKPSESSYWIHLGRDEVMEQAVLSSIVRRYGGQGLVADSQ